MELKDEFKYLVGAYFGIRYMDEYDLKVYVLKDIENYIRDFIKENPIPNYNYKEEAKKFESELSMKTKLQDSLLVLPKIDASIELTLLVKARLRKVKEKELKEQHLI